MDIWWRPFSKSKMAAKKFSTKMATLVFVFSRVITFKKCEWLQISINTERKYIAILTSVILYNHVAVNTRLNCSFFYINYMYFPYSHKSWQRVTLASQLFQLLLAFRWTSHNWFLLYDYCYQFQRVSCFTYFLFSAYSILLQLGPTVTVTELHSSTTFSEESCSVGLSEKMCFQLRSELLATVVRW